MHKNNENQYESKNMEIKINKEISLLKLTNQMLISTDFSQSNYNRFQNLLKIFKEEEETKKISNFSDATTLKLLDSLESDKITDEINSM